MPRKSVQEERRLQILSALNECLMKKPFHKISNMDIAKSAGVNHGVLYYYFKSKEDILLNYIDYTIRKNKDSFVEWLKKNTKKEESAGSLSLKALNYMIKEISMNRNLSKVFIEIWAIANYNSKVKKMMQSLYNEWENTISGVIEEIGYSSEEAVKISLALIAFFEGISLFTIIRNEKSKQIDEILIEVKSYAESMIIK